MNAVNPGNYEPEVSTDNWDDDFAEISSVQLAAFEQRDQEEEITKTIRAIPRQLQARPYVPENDIDEGDFEDNGEELQLRIKVKALEVSFAAQIRIKLHWMRMLTAAFLTSL
jgi:hypothetical protein